MPSISPANTGMAQMHRPRLYHGEEFEKNVIERGYFALVKHVNRVLRIRVWHGTSPWYSATSSADSSRREWVKRSSPSSVAGF
jgi:hypothetical protein